MSRDKIGVLAARQRNDLEQPSTPLATPLATPCLPVARPSLHRKWPISTARQRSRTEHFAPTMSNIFTAPARAVFRSFISL